MIETNKLNKVLETVAWGALLIWWGISFVPHFLPNGGDAAGTGVILLAVNAVRKLKGIRVNGYSLTFGILTIVWGVLDMGRSVLHLSYRPPILAILLIVLGLCIVVAVTLNLRRTGGVEQPQAAGPHGA
jgi:hypothetical protein